MDPEESIYQAEKPFLMEPNELAERLTARDNILLVDVRPQDFYDQGHIPGAAHVAPKDLVSGVMPCAGKMPPLEQLQELFNTLGLTPDTLVVAYDNEGGGWAGRMIWTLDMIGHYASSYLNGGLKAWGDANLPLTALAPTTRPKSDLKLRLQPQYRVEFEELRARFREVVVWDARGASEYRGDKNVTAHGGHIPGAINLEWLKLMDQDLRLRKEDDLRALLAKKASIRRPKS